MPSEPVMSIQELARSCTGALKRWRKLVSGAIRQAATPTPISVRASSSPGKLRASANATQATTATDMNPSSTRFGP